MSQYAERIKYPITRKKLAEILLMDRNRVTKILTKLNIPMNRSLTAGEVEAFKAYFFCKPRPIDPDAIMKVEGYKEREEL